MIFDSSDFQSLKALRMRMKEWKLHFSYRFDGWRERDMSRSLKRAIWKKAIEEMKKEEQK